MTRIIFRTIDRTTIERLIQTQTHLDNVFDGK